MAHRAFPGWLREPSGEATLDESIVMLPTSPLTDYSHLSDWGKGYRRLRNSILCFLLKDPKQGKMGERVPNPKHVAIGGDCEDDLGGLHV